jgi:hypothetical protein
MRAARKAYGNGLAVAAYVGVDPTVARRSIAAPLVRAYCACRRFTGSRVIDEHGHDRTAELRDCPTMYGRHIKAAVALRQPDNEPGNRFAFRFVASGPRVYIEASNALAITESASEEKTPSST